MTTQTDLQALLPCPFCGGEAEYNSWDRDPGYGWQIICSNKRCKVGPYVSCDDEDPLDVYEEWNTRAALFEDAESESAMVERVANALYQLKGPAATGPKSEFFEKASWKHREDYICRAKAAIACIKSYNGGSNG